ncbi:MAG: hypothetical protein DRP94_07705 [Candidatus Latescibacterota bacterium]|nr:MAG: hypothetical protein DRP94_07705 [Candidatus Latescibacterota bacterium]RKY74666.1 MAG: hypothetical protein DRQ14_01250 [Candidatus Latescibacterota bacterium]HDI00019.1 hypothetical protein [Bacillota bacterium]
MRRGIVVITAIVMILSGTQSGLAEKGKSSFAEWRSKLTQEERAELISKLHPQDRKAIERGLYPPEVVDALLYRIKRWGDYLRPQLSEEERAARLAELSEEEREVLRKRYYILVQTRRMLLVGKPLTR